MYYISSLLHSDECRSHAIFHQACLKYCMNDTWYNTRIKVKIRNPCWTTLIEPSMFVSKVNGVEVLQTYILFICFTNMYLSFHITNTFVDIIHFGAYIVIECMPIQLYMRGICVKPYTYIMVGSLCGVISCLEYRHESCIRTLESSI